MSGRGSSLIGPTNEPASLRLQAVQGNSVGASGSNGASVTDATIPLPRSGCLSRSAQRGCSGTNTTAGACRPRPPILSACASAVERSKLDIWEEMR